MLLKIISCDVQSLEGLTWHIPYLSTKDSLRIGSKSWNHAKIQIFVSLKLSCRPSQNEGMCQFELAQSLE